MKNRPTTPGLLPLRAQIGQLATRSPADGEWKPGCALLRLRTLAGGQEYPPLSDVPVVYDNIRLPARQPQGILGTMVEDPVNAHKGMLYSLYETRYRIRIVATHERIRAALADATVAPLLGVTIGAPPLCDGRVAFTDKNRPVEWRLSYINTERHYFFDALN